jgi:hypothetical protein
MHILNKHRNKSVNKDSLCCVFVNHKIDFSDVDYSGLQSQLKLASDYPFVFILPDNIRKEAVEEFLGKASLTDIQRKNISYKLLPAQYFKSIQDYSILMSSELFYSLLSDYQFILTLQPDVFICDYSKVTPLINDMEQDGYDYAGAPWLYDLSTTEGLEELDTRSQYTFTKKLKYQFFRIFFKLNLISTPKHIDLIFNAGNGGCSIRRTKTFLKLSKQLGSIKDVIGDEKWNYLLQKYTMPHFLAEDIYWSQIAGRKLKLLKVMPPSQSLKYFWESGIPRVNLYLSKKKIPLAIHAWYKFAFKEFVSSIIKNR